MPSIFPTYISCASQIGLGFNCTIIILHPFLYPIPFDLLSPSFLFPFTSSNIVLHRLTLPIHSEHRIFVLSVYRYNLFQSLTPSSLLIFIISGYITVNNVPNLKQSNKIIHKQYNIVVNI